MEPGKVRPNKHVSLRLKTFLVSITWKQLRVTVIALLLVLVVALSIWLKIERGRKPDSVNLKLEVRIAELELNLKKAENAGVVWEKVAYNLADTVKFWKDIKQKVNYVETRTNIIELNPDEQSEFFTSSIKRIAKNDSITLRRYSKND